MEISARAGRLLGFAGVVLVCAGIPGLVAGLLYGLSPGPTNAADRFLALLAKGKTHEAYAGASSAFRRRQDAGALAIEAKKLSLDGCGASSWSQVTTEDDKATLEGTVTTRDGEVVYLVVNLVKEQDEWRVLTLAARPAPEPAEEGGETPSDG